MRISASTTHTPQTVQGRRLRAAVRRRAVNSSSGWFGFFLFSIMFPDAQLCRGQVHAERARRYAGEQVTELRRHGEVVQSHVLSSGANPSGNQKAAAVRANLVQGSGQCRFVFI